MEIELDRRQKMMAPGTLPLGLHLGLINMSDRTICPICKKAYSDILKHFVLAHNIRNMEQLMIDIEKSEEKDNIKIQFRNYVEDLKKKIANGEITPKDYRELIMRWSKEQKASE